jgi:hypothetical protein
VDVIVDAVSPGQREGSWAYSARVIAARDRAPFGKQSMNGEIGVQKS